MRGIHTYSSPPMVVVDVHRIDPEEAPEGNLFRAYVEIEQAKSRADLARVAARLSARLTELEDTEDLEDREGLESAFMDLVREVVARLKPGDTVPDLGENLAEAAVRLIDSETH